MKNFSRTDAAIILLLRISWFLSACTDTHLGRWASWNFTDFRVHEKFPNYGFAPLSEPFHSTSNDQIG